MSKVILLGAGMGGLAAAHELLEPERGYIVEIYEKSAVPGGKARSTTPPAGPGGGNPGLPNEHGFRFFPGFYRHIQDTMQRIAVGTGSVADRLVQATEITFAQLPHPSQPNQPVPPLILPARAPKAIGDVLGFLDAIRAFHAGLPLSEAELWTFLRKIACFMGSGNKRREQDYDLVPWTTFIEADLHGPNYKKFLANGLTRSLVAMQPERGSTLTVGTILVQILLDIIEPHQQADRVLDGPTSEVWIEPWMQHLQTIGNANGQRLFEHFRHEVIALQYDSQANRIVSATVRDLATGTTKQVGSAADHFLCALPVEVVRDLLPANIKAAANVTGVDSLTVRWMSGVLAYLKREVGAPHGHVIYLDSPWALTSIDQQQFWRHNGTDIGASYGDGQVKEILSAIISEWEEPGHFTQKKAQDAADQDEIFTEVWKQLKAHRAGWPPAAGKLEDADKVGMWLDPAIGGFGAIPLTNAEPLLVNVVGSRQHRPDAVTGIENLFLASDYVRTFTDLATMEAANEAGRRAVTGILDVDDPARTISRPAIMPLDEPDFFDAIKATDDAIYQAHKNLGLKPPEPLLCSILGAMSHEQFQMMRADGVNLTAQIQALGQEDLARVRDGLR
jgi:uncharacterized protein with NAD-binding domain and iron-sulfur cluster